MPASASLQINSEIENLSFDDAILLVFTII